MHKLLMNKTLYDNYVPFDYKLAAIKSILFTFEDNFRDLFKYKVSLVKEKTTIFFTIVGFSFSKKDK